MLKTIEWGHNRYKPMVMAAQTVAISAPECYELVVLARKGLILPDSKTGKMSLPTWLECYRRPSNVEAGLMQCLMGSDETKESESFQQEWRRGRRQFLDDLRTIRPGERERKWAERVLKVAYRAHVRDLEKTLSGRVELPENVGAWFDKTEIVFFLSVAAPCLLEYHCWPIALLGQARGGDMVALERLLRLDANVVHLKPIADQLFHLQATNPDRHRLLMAEAAEGRTKAIARDDVKFAFAGLLSKWTNEFEDILRGELAFELLLRLAPPGREEIWAQWIKRERKRRQRERHGCGLSVPAIRKLFDAVAYDMGQGLVDPDTQQDPEAYRRRVSRNSELWPSLRNWDKSRAA